MTLGGTTFAFRNKNTERKDWALQILLMTVLAPLADLAARCLLRSSPLLDLGPWGYSPNSTAAGISGRWRICKTDSSKLWNLIKYNTSTNYNLSNKNFNPLCVFIHYGKVTNDFVMLQGCVVGTKWWVLIFCKSQLVQTTWPAWRRLTLNISTPCPSSAILLPDYREQRIHRNTQEWSNCTGIRTLLLGIDCATS